MGLALARIGFAVLVSAAMAPGLFTATLAIGVVIPVDEARKLRPVQEDAVFAAVAALGCGILFAVPPRLLWACVDCGITGHTLRIALLRLA